MADFPITLPDQSLTTVFDTLNMVDIPRGQSFEAKVALTPNSTQVEASMIPYTWDMQNGVVTQTSGQASDLKPQKVTGDNWQALLPPFSIPSACLVTWKWIDENGFDSEFQEAFSSRYFMPSYLKLSSKLKDLCQTTLNSWLLLADNAYGNSRPNLAEHLQIQFSLETVAQAMQRAFISFQVPVIAQSQSLLSFPLSKWAGLLYKATLRELISMVLTGYTETPEMTGGNDTPVIDRNRYFDRWSADYTRIDKDYQDLLKQYRNYYKNFNSGVVLVGGGMYGAAGPLLSNQAWNALYNGQLVNSFRPVTMNYDLN